MLQLRAVDRRVDPLTVSAVHADDLARAVGEPAVELAHPSGTVRQHRLDILGRDDQPGGHGRRQPKELPLGDIPAAVTVLRLKQISRIPRILQLVVKPYEVRNRIELCKPRPYNLSSI